jgi:hypothetical protein
MSDRAATLMGRLGLSEDELCQVLDTDALTLLSGQAERAPELRILLDLLDETAAQVAPTALRRWARATGPHGKPIDALLARDFATFEDALEELARRGIVIRRRSPASPPPQSSRGDPPQDSGSGGFSGQAPIR